MDGTAGMLRKKGGNQTSLQIRQSGPSGDRWIDVADTVQVPVIGMAGVTAWGVAYSYFVAAMAMDLTDFTEVRFSVRVDVAGAGTERAQLGYSADAEFGSYTLLGSTIALATTGMKRSDWIALPTAARTMTKFEVGIGVGNTITEITLSVAVVEVRR